jgi:plasmid stabilization system protein ParE
MPTLSTTGRHLGYGDGRGPIGFEELSRLSTAKGMSTKSTPYVIPYRVHGGRLEIIAVFHGRQRWRNRL